MLFTYTQAKLGITLFRQICYYSNGLFTGGTRNPLVVVVAVVKKRVIVVKTMITVVVVEKRVVMKKIVATRAEDLVMTVRQMRAVAMTAIVVTVVVLALKLPLIQVVLNQQNTHTFFITHNTHFLTWFV